MHLHVIYSTQGYQYMLDEYLGSLKGEYYAWCQPGDSVRISFPDGEVYHRLNPKQIENNDIIIIGGTHDSDNTLELYDMGCSMIKHGARSLTMIIPYFGYSTMERAVKPGEIVKAKTRARLLSSIPSGAKPNRIVFVDLHTEGLPHYLEGNVQPVHLYAKDLVITRCLQLAGVDFVLGSTDAGRAKWIESLSKEMGVGCAIITKRRTSGSETEITSINADVKDKVVIIYDDMIRTGGSVIKAAAEYRKAGASSVHVIATHGVFPANSVSKLLEDTNIDTISVSNSHPNSIKYTHPKYTVMHLEALFTDIFV